MKMNKYISVTMVCLLTLATAACSKTQTGVVNTNNALYVQKAFKLGTNNEPQETQMKGRVIKLGNSGDSSDFGPSFEFHRLRTN